MCIAIYKPAGKVIDRDTLHRCYLKNKDGCGFAYFKTDGELVIIKSMDFQSFYEDYEFHSVLNSDRPFLIHFRIATHGTVNLFNCHPFKIDDNHVMIHNGIIHNIRNCPDKKRSDTQMFVDDILKELPPHWMFNWGITNLIEDYIGASKVVVLAADDSVTIYNESKGEWHEDVWYSNSGYKEPVRYYHHSDKDYYGGRYSGSNYNYERPKYDAGGEKIGVYYGRWEYDHKTNTHEWIEAEREVTGQTPGAVWGYDTKKGKMGWVIPTAEEPKREVRWTFNKETGEMQEFINGSFTGRAYPASKKKLKHLMLLELKREEELKAIEKQEYEKCNGCCQDFPIDELFVVDEFKNADDCFICQKCIDDFLIIDMPMSNPVKLSDIRLLEKEIQNVCQSS